LTSMEIVKVLSDWKKGPVFAHTSKNGVTQNRPIKRGFKRVMASVKIKGRVVTRHIDVKAT
jgi:hypothetical protein